MIIDSVPFTVANGEDVLLSMLYTWTILANIGEYIRIFSHFQDRKTILNHVRLHVSWLHHVFQPTGRDSKPLVAFEAAPRPRASNGRLPGPNPGLRPDHRGEDSPDRSPDRIARLEEALVSQQELLLGIEKQGEKS